MLQFKCFKNFYMLEEPSNLAFKRGETYEATEVDVETLLFLEDNRGDEHYMSVSLTSDYLEEINE